MLTQARAYDVMELAAVLPALPVRTTAGTPAAVVGTRVRSMSDEALIDRMLVARNGAAIYALLRGTTSAYAYTNPDGTQNSGNNEADLALVRHLAFWTGGDAQRIDRIFRSTGLMRPKWDERHAADGRTYGEMTIQMVLDNAGASYSRTSAAGQQHE